MKQFLHTIKGRLRPLWDVEPLLTSHDLEACRVCARELRQALSRWVWGEERLTIVTAFEKHAPPPEKSVPISLRLVVALVCAAILGGCAPSVDRSDTSPASSPATPTPPAGNVFAPEPNHYFGSGGP